jgi:small conductance mechanosensitive channel
VVGIAYESDVPKAKEVLMQVLKNNQWALSDPAPQVAVSELADSSVNLVVRPWCKPEDYWDIYFSVTEQAKVALEANGISIPFPQRDVHIHESKVA